MIKITVPPGISEQTVLDYFKKKAKSGGGTIAYMQKETDKDVYYIFFEDQDGQCYIT